MMKKTIYWQHPRLPIFIERFEFPTDELNIETAKNELETLIAQKSDGVSSTWGFFPELNPDLSEYPETIKLADQFRQQVIDVDIIFQKVDLQLAFVRRALSEPVSDFGGLHVDVSAGIDHNRAEGHEGDAIFRTLFNLGDTIRTLEYCDFTVHELADKGIHIADDHYEILAFPSEITFSTAGIPPLEKNAIYGLRFISTLVPHAGKTNQDGHFLISFGGYEKPDTIKQLFER